MGMLGTHRPPGEFINVCYIESSLSNQVFVYAYTFGGHFGGLSNPGRSLIRFEHDETNISLTRKSMNEEEYLVSIGMRKEFARSYEGLSKLSDIVGKPLLRDRKYQYGAVRDVYIVPRGERVVRSLKPTRKL